MSEIEIKSWIEDHKIIIEEFHKSISDSFNKTYRKVFDTEEKIIRDGLIKLGWTPPDEKKDKPTLAPWPWEIRPNTMRIVGSDGTEVAVPYDNYHARFIVAMRWFKKQWDEGTPNTIPYKDINKNFVLVAQWMRTINRFLETGDEELLK